MLASLMTRVLDDWNQLEPGAASKQILPCCGSRRWADDLAKNRPYQDLDELYQASDRVWLALTMADWQEAFDSHPRIGERDARRSIGANAQIWSQEEQGAISRDPQSRTVSELADANAAYEAKFGRIFIVCASGKTASQILGILRSRLENDANTELSNAVEEQRKITRLRLQRCLEEAAQ